MSAPKGGRARTTRRPPGFFAPAEAPTRSSPARTTSGRSSHRSPALPMAPSSNDCATPFGAPARGVQTVSIAPPRNGSMRSSPALAAKRSSGRARNYRRGLFLMASGLERPMAADPAPLPPSALRRRLVFRALSFALLLIAWEAASRVTGARSLPSVATVATALGDEFEHHELAHHLSVTLARVFAAFVIAMGLGTALGLAMGHWRSFDLVFDGWVILLLNMPALVCALLAYVWFGRPRAV